MSEIKQDQSQINETDDILKKYEWMIRPCHIYKDEYKDCSSFKSRFHQYFVFGELKDCSQWKIDYNECSKWQKNDKESGVKIIISENKRKQERLKNHYNNTVWEKRKTPPEDWVKPLPKWMQKDQENTFLSIKQQELEINQKSEIDFFANRTTCTIL